VEVEVEVKDLERSGSGTKKMQNEESEVE